MSAVELGTLVKISNPPGCAPPEYKDMIGRVLRRESGWRVALHTSVGEVITGAARVTPYEGLVRKTIPDLKPQEVSPEILVVVREWLNNWPILPVVVHRSGDQYMRAERPSFEELEAELLALQKEFSPVKVGFENGWLVVEFLAKNVVLRDTVKNRDVVLGEFKVQLKMYRNEVTCDYSVRCFAAQPNKSKANSRLTHPHVENDVPCLGEAKLHIISAVRSLRLSDFAVCMSAMLNSYNPGSAHANGRLEIWDGFPCGNCGDTRPSQPPTCYSCRGDCCVSCEYVKCSCGAIKYHKTCSEKFGCGKCKRVISTYCCGYSHKNLVYCGQCITGCYDCGVRALREELDENRRCKTCVKPKCYTCKKRVDSVNAEQKCPKCAKVVCNTCGVDVDPATKTCILCAALPCCTDCKAKLSSQPERSEGGRCIPCYLTWSMGGGE